MTEATSKAESSLQSRPNLSHVGIYVWDIKKIENFYCKTLDLVVTDRGVGNRFQNQLAFMSSQPNMHHQLALASGRAQNAPSTVMQLSFKVTKLDQLRFVRAKALANGATEMFGLNHGNAWPIYFTTPRAIWSKSMWIRRSMCRNRTAIRSNSKRPMSSSCVRPRRPAERTLASCSCPSGSG